MSTSTNSESFMNLTESEKFNTSVTTSKNTVANHLQDSFDLQDVLFTPSTITSRSLDKESDDDVMDTSENISMTLMTRQSNKDLGRQTLKRKISSTSPQQVIPLSEQLRRERGEIGTGQGSLSINESSETMSILSPVSLQLSDSPAHSPSFQLNTNADPTVDTGKPVTLSDLQGLYSNSNSVQEETSALPQANTITLSDETSLSDFASHKSLQAILQLQMQIWRKLLKLKQSTQLLEKSYPFRPMSETEENEISNENDKSSAVTIEQKLPVSLFNSSLKVVCSQLDIDTSADSILASSELPRSTISCYKKMNQVQDRLTDVEFRIASIHGIIHEVREKHYRELKASVGQKLENMLIGKTDFDLLGDGNMLDIKTIEAECKSDPPVTRCELNLFGQVLSPYDENYYDWRQYHMNRMHYKKSERTIALNKRPILRILKPPVLKLSSDKSNRAKKPHFVNTPSRVNH